MNWTSLTRRFREWIADMKQTLETTKSESDAMNSPEWYAGLAVSPASFSRQLGSMQASLLQANTSRPNSVQSGGATAETVAVRSLRVT